MVREVGVHDDHVVSRGVFEAVDVGGPQAEFPCARVQFDVQGADGGDELFGDFLGAVGGAVVDDYYFPVEVSGEWVVGLVAVYEGLGRWSSVLLFEGLLEEPDDDGQVAAFVVGGEQDGVFVADCHGGRLCCIIPGL
jgi:hypothetical protein